jgi:hypothetical protein
MRHLQLNNISLLQIEANPLHSQQLSQSHCEADG